MKSLIRLLSLCFVLLLTVSAIAEAPADDNELQAKYEQRVFKCLETLTKCLTDDINVYGTPKEVLKGSDAWKRLSKYDGGWFSKNISKTIKNPRTDGWERVSDTEFCVNVYCDYEVVYVRNREPVVYPCAYHLCFAQTDARKDVWMIQDFHVLENPNDLIFAEKLTSENEGITVTPVIGATFTGFMMTIDDPSRVFVGTIPRFRSSAGAMTIDEIVELNDALGGINGGGFNEGNAASPMGIVYSMGEHKQEHTPNHFLTRTLIGFDENNKLHVGNYSIKEVDQMNLRDALGFGPALIIEGEAQETGDKQNEYSTRTAIGQDAEGRVLMLAIRGRQPDSMGADMKDLIKIMQDFGAVNAGNLDGGMSTAMYLNKTIVYSGYRLEASRTLPCGFLIRK